MEKLNLNYRNRDKVFFSFFIVAIFLISSFSYAGDLNQIIGQEAFRYRVNTEKLKVPKSISDSWGSFGHVHGITRDEDDNVYVTYSTPGRHGNQTRALLKFDSQGEFLGTLGDKTIARGTPHGLDGRKEGEDFYLYHSNNMGRFFKRISMATNCGK